MNTLSSLQSAAASMLFAGCVLSSLAPRAAAQQFGGVIPVANPAAPSVAGTPSTATDVPVIVENPPPAEKLDPNAPTETEILATDGADFSSTTRIAVFKGDVRVNDPRFQLACAKLTVYLAKAVAADDAGGEATPAPGNTPPPVNGGKPSAKGASDDRSPGGGIDHAVAEGGVIIIQKRAATKPGEEPKVSIGRADRADFDNKTGDMVLRGKPSVEQNGNTHVALSPSTVMTLHKDNSMTTVGPSRTVIKQQHKEEPAGISPAASPGTPGKPGGKTRTRNNNGSQG